MIAVTLDDTHTGYKPRKECSRSFPLKKRRIRYRRNIQKKGYIPKVHSNDILLNVSVHDSLECSYGNFRSLFRDLNPHDIVKKGSNRNMKNANRYVNINEYKNPGTN